VVKSLCRGFGSLGKITKLKGKNPCPPVHHPWETSVGDEKQVNYELVNLSYFLLTLPW